jgi:hypothetical protein
MNEIKLDGIRIQQGVKDAVLDALGIDQTGMAVGQAQRIETELKEKLADKTIYIGLIDALTHGAYLIDLVTFCYDRKCGLKFGQDDIRPVIDYYVARLVADQHMPESVAQNLAARMFPGGRFIHTH